MVHRKRKVCATVMQHRTHRFKLCATWSHIYATIVKPRVTSHVQCATFVQTRALFPDRLFSAIDKLGIRPRRRLLGLPGVQAKNYRRQAGFQNKNRM